MSALDIEKEKRDFLADYRARHPELSKFPVSDGALMANPMMKDIFEGWLNAKRATPPSPSTASEAGERAAFEAWAELTDHQKRGVLHDVTGWYYFDEVTQDRWEAWQARAALAAKTANECNQGRNCTCK